MKSEKERLRCFVSIEFSDEVIKEVARVQESVWNKRFNGKLTELENLHLTLKFLGEIDKFKLRKVKKALTKIELKEFSTSLGKIGLFYHNKKPRIVWIKISGKGIYELQKKVDEALEKEGFRKEERFMSHLTIARVKDVKDFKGFKESIESIDVKNIPFKVKEFKLKKSELKFGGPVYKTLLRYRLDKEI